MNLDSYHIRRIWLLMVVIFLPMFAACSEAQKLSEERPCLNALKDREKTEIKSSQPLFPIKEKGKWGFIDHSGNVVIQPKFEEVRQFSENFAAFKDAGNGKWGYVNRDGLVKVRPSFINASIFSDDKAVITDENGMKGAIDKEGKLLVRPLSDNIKTFSEDRSFALRGGRWRLIGGHGEYISDDSFIQVNPFREGLASFRGLNNNYNVSGFVDMQGAVQILLSSPLSVEMGWDGFSYGKAIIYRHKLLFTGRKKKAYGLIDRKGEVSIAPRYDSVVIESSCIVRAYKRGSYGAVTHRGRNIVPFAYKQMGGFSEGLALAFPKHSEYYGYINWEGEFVIRPQFKRNSLFEQYGGREFRNGRALFVNSLGKFGVIDREGSVVVEPVFDEAFPFRNGLSKFEMLDVWGYIDINGEVVWSSGDFSHEKLSNLGGQIGSNRD